MRLTRDMWCRAGKWIGICLTAMAFGWIALAQAVSTTTVQGMVYLANGQPGSGTLQVSWPAFTTSNNLAVAAGRTTVSIGSDGFVSVNLAPNLGSSPAGLYYTAVYHMSDGTTSTEYWVVPAAAQASIASVRAQVMPAAQAVQAVSKAYVDQAIESLATGSLSPVGGTLTSPLYLNGDPSQPLQAADKHYVDETYSAAVPLSGGNMVGALAAPSVTASLNKVLLVTAAPYNAKCDGVTDDQAAIQAAFNDAYTNGYSVEFPAGTCLTSTIQMKGQSFFGHGKYVTSIVGRPGQDVFQTPDPSTNPRFPQSAYIHDLSIQVDASVDASATAGGGNNTFPYRVTGTAGGLTPLPQAPAPGPMIFGSPLTCSGQIIADSTGAFDEFYLPCVTFSSITPAALKGAPILIYNASGALVMNTTIASLIDDTHLKLNASAGSAQSNLSGTYLNPIVPPWYVGNCGMAFPMADGKQNGGIQGALIGWVFENIAFSQTGTNQAQSGHSCGIFMQANNYSMNYEHVDTASLYGGILEALPYQNVAYVTWTPDTTKYFDVNLSHSILPLVTYNGAHRVLDGVSIYGGAWNSPQGMGMWMLSASTGSSAGLGAYLANASITRFYFECGSFLSGEAERFTGQSVTLTGGSTTQCGTANLGSWMTPAFLNWNVSDGSLDAQVGSYLQINGDHNTLTHTDLSLGAVTDNGFENRVQTGINVSDPSVKRAFYANLDMPQDPVGKLNGDFLLNGNSASPFVSGSDLLTTCRDYRVLTSMCVNDPNGMELVKSYVHAPATGGTVSEISTGSVAVWNYLMVAGSRIPLAPVYVVAQGRCQGASSCSSAFIVRDRVTGNTIGSCNYTFGSSWTIQGGPTTSPCLVNFSSVPSGDAVGWDTNSWTASGLTAVDISFVGFQPQSADLVNEVLSSGQLSGLIQASAPGAPVNLTAANWRWGNNNFPGVVDASSPLGHSTAIGDSWPLFAWNGSTNLNGGLIYPAVPSTVSYLVQAPTVLTNTLGGAMAATDSSMTVSVPTTNAYASGGCFQVDQEIVCYSGALTVGSTSIAISRGQYGTMAQAHANGATLSSVGTGVFYVTCNSTNYATTNVVFGPNWSYQSSPFAAQNCSGTNTNIHLGFPNGPSGQTYKIAAVQIAQNPGSNPPATGSNQVPVSGSVGGQLGWTSTKTVTGNGAAITTGPMTSTSGNVAVFASNNGQIADGSIPLSSLASLSATGTQTFSGPVTATTGNFTALNATTVAAKNLAVSILSFGAKCDGVTDDTSAFNAAWASINTAGGEIDLPSGTCYVPNGLKFNQTTPNSNTTRIIRGLGIWQSIILTHNANIGLELGGVVGIVLKDFTLHDNGTTAAAGIARYRPDWTQGYSGQCGGHVYDHVAVNGNYSVANLYSIGCEVNDHRDLSLTNGGTGVGLAIAQNNCLGMTGMTMPINATGASDTVNHFFGGAILYYGTSATGAAVYFCNGSADDVTFHGTYFVANSPAANIVFGHSSTDFVQGTKSFHSVRFEGTGDAFVINAASVGSLTVDSGSTFGVTSPGIDIHQVNTTWAGGSNGLTQADIHGVSLSGSGVTLGNVFNSNINIVGDQFTLLNNALINESHIEANAFIFPSNYGVLGSVLTQNDDSTAATGGLKVYYGPIGPNGTQYGSAVVMKPFNTSPANPVNGELAIADGVNWKPSGITSQTLVQYNSGATAWQPVVSSSAGLPTNNPVFTGTLTGPNETITGVYQAGGGTVGAPAYAFSSNTGAGMYLRSGVIEVSTGGSNPLLQINGNGVVAGGFLGLASGAVNSNSPAAFMRLTAVGTACLGSSSSNCSGIFQSAQLQLGSSQQTTFDANGNKHEAGTAPTASAGTLTGTNAGGYVASLSAATSVTVTFANSGWNTWASCTASPSVSLSAAPYVSAISKSAVTFTFPSLTGTLYYNCSGN
jgi:Pectate lyase superfamily protein